MKKILAGLLSLVLVFALIGCGGKTPESTTQATNAPTTETTAPALTDVYTQAAAPLRDAQNLKIELTTKKEISGLGGSFSSVSKQALTLSGIGTDAFSAAMTEELEMGEYDDKFTEYFADGTLYLNVYDIGYFQGEMSAADYLNRFAPAVLLDETLYGDVTTQEDGAGIKMMFADPIGPELWAVPENAKFLNASGTAQIADNGALASTVYTVDYIHGSTAVSMQVTAKAEVYNFSAPEAPQNPYRYNKIDNIEVPRLYDTAVLYLASSEAASSTLNQTIVSQAAGYTRVEQTVLHYTGIGDDHISNVQQTVSSVDSTGSTETYTLEESFRDGQYSYCENGGSAEPDSSVKAAEMASYLQGYCSDHIPSLDYVSSAKLEDVNGLFCIQMELNPEWGKLTSQTISYELFKDAAFLDNYATDYETVTGSYCMVVDPATGFPISSSVTYSGVHTIEGEKYTLAQERIQSYRLADSSTYHELTGENAAESAPTAQATPLLYRVTGADSQEMYLMGTIHVGDEKTAFLPNEIYAAFDASDALAVEANVIAFEEKAETDAELMTQLRTAYANSSGKAMRTLLGDELYEKTVRLMKATGDYTSSMEYMKPFVWTSSIENTYMTLGRLRSEKGMDMRLLMRAMEQDKKILEVESSMFQFEMMADFSYELQAMLLEETVTSTAAEYCTQVQELYDLWCAGDETALRDVLKEETSDLTEDELVLYQEYNKAMIVDRNAGMLDVAVSYLESGETVFYAVGLAHLLQDNGLVDTLREAGYTVEQVIYS